MLVHQICKTRACASSLRFGLASTRKDEIGAAGSTMEVAKAVDDTPVPKA